MTLRLNPRNGGKIMRLVQSLKITDKFVEVRYNQQRDDSVDEFSLKVKDPPHPDLVAALAAIRPDVVGILEQPGAFAEGLTVRKVSWAWKYDKDAGEQRAKVTIHATKSLQNNNSPWNCHTPLTEPDGDLIDSLQMLHDEALEYVDGKRAQGSLPLGDEQEGE